MSEITIIFKFEEKQTKINSSVDVYFREPAKKYALSIEKKLGKLDFVYNSLKIKLSTKVKDICKEKKEIEILVSENKAKEPKLQYKILEGEDKIKIFGDLFVKNNKNNFKIVLINDEEKELAEFYDLKAYPVNQKKKIIEFQLKQIKDEVTSLSMMFQDCKNLISIQDLSMIETDKVTDMSYLFSNCLSLSSLPDLSIWNTENVTNMSYLFNGCTSLKELPDISYWNTEKVTNMSYLFYGTSSLKSVPDISKWNVSKLTNILNIFSGGLTLDSFPDISKWHQILFNLGKAKENEEKKEYVYLSKDCYYFTCKNCKNTPEVIVKDNQTVLLKCNSCNIFENEKIEKIRNFQSPWLAKMSLKPCNKHGDAEAVKYCTKCSLYLCPECLTEHDQNNKGHPLTDVANMVYNICSNHSKEFTHFCIDCRKEICSKCQAEHKKHKMKISTELYMQDIIDDEEEKKENDKKPPVETKSKNSKNEKKSDNEKKDDSDDVIWYGDKKEDEKRSEKNDKKSENKSVIKEIKEDRDEDKDKDKEYNKEANAIILSCSLFEAFFSKAAINTVNKTEIVKNALLTIKVYEEINGNFKKMLAHYPNEFNKKTENDLNLLILSKIIFFTSKQLKNFDIELLSNLNYALNSIVPKINEQAYGDFKDYMNSTNKDFTLCLQKVSDKEFKKLQTNLDYLLAPVHKSLSDSDKTSSFASKIYESSKILQKYIAFEKMREPDKLLNIDDAFKDPRILSKIFNFKDDSHLVLSLFGKLLQKYNINVSVFKNKDDKLKNIELTSLNSLLTMANKKKYAIFFDYTEEQINEINNDVIKKESLKYKMKNKIATKLNINKNEIVMNEVEPYEDFENKKKVLKMSFIISNHSRDYSKELKQFTEEETNMQKRVSVNNALEILALSPGLLDPRGNKHSEWNTNKKRGGINFDPPGEGWYGLGINVLDKYENNDWLKSDNKEGEFAIGYLDLNNLLTNRPTINNLTHSLHEVTPSKDNNQYRPKRREGVIAFQKFNYAENTAGIVDIAGYRVKIILMCRVNPSKIRRAGPKFWILNQTPDEIRPYRILFKVFPCSPLAMSKDNKTINEIITRNSLKEKPKEEKKEKEEGQEQEKEKDDLTFGKKNKRKAKIEDISKLNGQMVNDDFFVIRLYTSEYYKYINEYLKTGKVIYDDSMGEMWAKENEPGQVFEVGELESWSKCLQLALSRNKNVDDNTVVYRGVGSRKFPKNINVGSKFYFEEFISASLEKSEVEKFKEDGGTLMIITIKNNGTNGHPNYCFNINDISCFDNEKEVLISAKCHYNVTNIQHKDKVDYVYLTCEGITT